MHRVSALCAAPIVSALLARSSVQARTFAVQKLLASLGLALAAGCAVAPPPTPTDEESSVIGISVDVRALKLFSKPAIVVYFVRIADGDPLSQQSMIPSNYVDGKYAYLFNAEPGRYAAVAAVVEGSSSASSGSVGVGGGASVSGGVGADFTFTTYFPSDLIEMTIVTVGPSSVGFMGRFTVDRSGLDGADEAQRHYYQQGGFATGLFARHYKGSLAKSDQSERAWQSFLDQSRKRVSEPGWGRVLQNPVAAGPRTP